MIIATYEISPVAAADRVAVQASTGMDAGPAEMRGTVVEQEGFRAVIEFPDANWAGNVTLLFSALVAGEAMEMAELEQCRLIDLQLPDRFLPGPAKGVPAGAPPQVGVIVKPSLGLSPGEVAAVARAAVKGGATFIKDDEVLGDPPFCPLDDRVAAVASVLADGVRYFANVNGPAASLVERARRAVDAGATGVLVNPFAQGLDCLVALREADLGVPILAHRAGSGPLVRNREFGATAAVLARLARLCGADYVMAGGFGGKLFDTDGEVRANVAALRGRCGSAPPAGAVVGGAVGADNAKAQVEAAGTDGVVVVLGSRAYGRPGGVEGSVSAVVEELSS